MWHKLSWKKLEPNMLTNCHKNLLKWNKKESLREIYKRLINVKSWKTRCTRQTWIPFISTMKCKNQLFLQKLKRISLLMLLCRSNPLGTKIQHLLPLDLPTKERPSQVEPPAIYRTTFIKNKWWPLFDNSLIKKTIMTNWSKIRWKRTTYEEICKSR